ncbi:hypothetical protein K461DRAFT_65371 [Myriangium duriaei CBS 260.36]|uniref:Uncharacterized protein n=1 Tax=Myriangium duriaei CBS 260.36 TaxID=1168546 RepID=A0A9P4MG28_9PEZI|nr:hypothetical protein K461DRAFT_65371 [Myriangium duriaei CBS 260.36]
MSRVCSTVTECGAALLPLAGIGRHYKSSCCVQRQLKGDNLPGGMGRTAGAAAAAAAAGEQQQRVPQRVAGLMEEPCLLRPTVVAADENETLTMYDLCPQTTSVACQFLSWPLGGGKIRRLMSYSIDSDWRASGIVLTPTSRGRTIAGYAPEAGVVGGP